MSTDNKELTDLLTNLDKVDAPVVAPAPAPAPVKFKRKKLTVEDVESALRATGGFTSQAAKLLGKAAQSVSTFILNHPHLQDVRKELEVEFGDLAETGLLHALVHEEEWAIKFYLDKKGQGRGYKTTSENLNRELPPLYPLPGSECSRS